MTGAVGASRLIVRPPTKPRLPRHVKLRYDARRSDWVLLAPERIMTLDETAAATLKLCDGTRTVAAIAGDLTTLYKGREPEVLADVIEMLQDLADKGVITE